MRLDGVGLAMHAGMRDAGKRVGSRRPWGEKS